MVLRQVRGMIMVSSEYYKVALLSIIATTSLFPESGLWYHLITALVFGLVADYQSSKPSTIEEEVE